MKVDNATRLAKDFERVVAAIARGLGDAVATLAAAKAAVAGGAPGIIEIAVKARQHDLVSGPGLARHGSLAGAVEKASVAVGTTTDADWAGPLVAYQTLASGWMASLRNISALDAIMDYALPVPAGTKLGIEQIATGAGSNPAEAAWTPLEKFDYSGVTATPMKSLALVVFSDALLRFGGTFAENAINQALKNAVATASDTNVFGTLLAGIGALASSGNARQDIASLLSAVPFGQNSKPILFVAPNIAKQLALIGQDEGPPAFPDMSVVGGGMIGLMPVLPVDALHDWAGSPSTGDSMVLVDCAQVAGDAGVVTLDATREASLAMVDSASGAQSMTSLFQSNSVALRAERWFILARPRATSVALMADCSYAAGSPS